MLTHITHDPSHYPPPLYAPLIYYRLQYNSILIITLLHAFLYYMSTNDPDSPTVGVRLHSNSPHFPKSKRIIHIGEI